MHASVGQIAMRPGMTRQTVQTHIKTLLAEGLLIKLEKVPAKNMRGEDGRFIPTIDERYTWRYQVNEEAIRRLPLEGTVSAVPSITKSRHGDGHHV